MNDKYKVIFNPQRLFTKQEVWFSGVADVQNEQGYLERRPVVKCLKAFRTEDEAEAFVKYVQEVKAFKEESNV